MTAVFRSADSRWPFLWAAPDQPPGRWHGSGEGPAHYFATTPEGAWAEVLRHEDITDPADLDGLQRDLWTADVELPDTSPGLPANVLTGPLSTWTACQAEARRLRAGGVASIITASAALRRGGARLVHVREGRARDEPVDSEVVVVWGPPDEIAGRLCAHGGRPDDGLPGRVRYLGRSGGR